MTASEIKKAVEKGHKVHWATNRYTVIKDNIGQFLIEYNSGFSKDYIGLTHRNGITLNGKESDFYIEA